MATAPRRRPGSKKDEKTAEQKEEQQAPPKPDTPLADTLAKPEEKSRAKAESAKQRANHQLDSIDSDSWPRGANGQPMMRVLMTASELIPTGQFANVSIGPAQITAFVDTQRVLEAEEPYFSVEERATLAQALNELAEIVEGDVVAVQRNLVLENLQETVASAN